jgi:hypothetical protein
VCTNHMCGLDGSKGGGGGGERKETCNIQWLQGGHLARALRSKDV